MNRSKKGFEVVLWNSRFGFGLYELFLTDLGEARLSRTSGRILRIKSLDDLKARLAKVILIILIVETFKDAFELKAQSPLELLYLGATIALIGLALYLTHGSESEKNLEPSAGQEPRLTLLSSANGSKSRKRIKTGY
jgi:uncharacterized membrane protein YqhA